jgi:membrane-bound ClpP family serine protease
MAGGVSLFLGATALVWFVTTRRVLVARVVTAVLLLPAIVPTAWLPPLGALLVALVLGVVLIVIERITAAFRLADS